MAKINTLNYQTVASWNGSEDLFVVEQPDGTKVATPAMVKQFIEAGDFTATGEIIDGYGNMLKDMAKSADVNTALAGKQDTLTFDNAPTQNSGNPVKSGGIFSTMAVPKYDSANRREYYEGGSAFSGNIDSTPTAGSNNAVASGGTKSYVDNLTNFLGFTHFVQIPFTTSVLDSIKAAFEDTTIPVDLFGITLGIVRGGAGSQRVIFIAQNQRLSTTQTRYAAIYFGAYTAPRFLQKQDGTDWTDVAL